MEQDVIGDPRQLVLDSYVAGIKGVAEGPLGYLSTQMTSGARMNRAAVAHGYHTTVAFKADPAAKAQVAVVVKENILRSNDLLALVRERSGLTVLTPTTLNVPWFTQDDYAWFWKQVMTTLKPTIFVSPEWEFSRGSRFEILDGFAARVRVFTVDPWGQELTEDEVKNIIAEVDASGRRW